MFYLSLHLRDGICYLSDIDSNIYRDLGITRASTNHTYKRKQQQHKINIQNGRKNHSTVLRLYVLCSTNHPHQRVW